jgi:hypothetical protein
MAPRDETSSDGAGAQSSGAAIGTVKTLTGAAVARHGDGTQVTLHKGDSIFEGDVLVTESGGAVGVVLADGTSLSLGEKGRLALNDYAYDAKSHSGDAHLSLESGSFALVSGQIAKTAPDAFALKTPTMTVGIRGTGVAGNASAVALMAERGGVAGEVVVTTPNGQTATLNSIGAAATFGSNGLVQQQLSPLQVMQIAGGAGAALPNGGALLAPAFNAAAQEVWHQQEQQQQQSPPPPPPPPSHGGETQGPPPGAGQTLTTLHDVVVAQVDQVKKQIAKDIDAKDEAAKDVIKTVTDDDLPPPATVHTPTGNAAPVVSSSQILSANRTVYSFTENDFLSHYSDAEGDPLVGIKILTLPLSGTLWLGEQPLEVGAVIARADLSSLSYVPHWCEDPALSVAPVQFLWVAFDGTNYATVPAVMTVGPLQISVDGLYDGSSETRPVEVTGGSGNDTLIGGTAFDTLIGGAGNDLIVSGTGGGIFDGGSGSNAISFAGVTLADRTLIVDLPNHFVSQYRLGDEMPSLFATVSHFETVIGSAGDDTIIGDDSANTLVGGAGADSLTGGGGADTFRYVAATDSPVQNHDVITDFTTGDRLDFAGMSGIVYDSTYAPELGGYVAATVAALAADPDITNQAVFFVQDNSGWLYIKGAGSGTSFDGTLIQLQGVLTPPPIAALSGVSPVPVVIPDGVLVPTGVLASDGTSPAGQATLDPTKFSANQLSLAFDVCLSPQLGNGSGSLVTLTDPNGQPWLDVRVENGQVALWYCGSGDANGPATVSVGAWHHLSLSFDGTHGDSSSARLYLDGTLVQKIPFDGSGSEVADFIQGLTVGASGFGNSAALFDNLTLWNVARGPHASNYGQGLVAQWSFNEDGAVDCVSSSGSAIPLTVGAGGRIVSYDPPAVRYGVAVGATGTDDAPPALGETNAIHLNGNGSAIRSATLFEPGTGDFTIELWAKPDALSGTQFLFSKDQSGNVGGWGLYIRDGVLIANLPGLGENVLSCAVADTNWHHFALTRAGLSLTLSIDGETSATFVTDHVYDLNNGIPTLIGGRFDNLFGDSQSMLTPSPTESLQGSVAEVRVWSTALDLTQLEAGKIHRLSGAEPDLVEYMPLNDRAANVAVTNVRDVVDPLVRADGAGAVTVSGLPVGSRAVDLSGSASGVVSPTRFDPGTGAFTVEVWARADSLAQTSMLFAKDQSDDVTGWSLQLSTDGHLVFAGPDGLTLQSTGVVTAGSWHHYAVTHSGDGDLTLYIDGTASGSMSGVTANFSNGIPSIVGARLNNDSTLQLSLDGAVSEVRLWSVERSEDQIVAGKATRLAGTEAGLVDYLPLDGTLTEIVPAEASDYRLAHADTNHLGEIQHQAVSFGNGSTASAGSAFTVGTSDFTVELWVNPTASGTLLSKGSALRLALVDGVPTVTLGGTIVMQGDSLPLESWSHLALTRENGTFRLYVDGVLNRVASGVTGAISSSDPLTFGGDHFSGLMAGLRLWNVARSEDDILGGLHVVSPTGSGLIGSWSGLVDNAASASVTNLSDASGHGHTLAFSNGTGLTDGGNPPLARSPVEIDGGEPYHGAAVATTIDGQPPTFTLTTPPQHGTLFLGTDGHYVYTPAHGYAGIDSFDITVGNGTLQRVQSVAVVVSPAVTIAGASQTVTALALDGNDSATIATASALRGLDDGSFTVEAWIKPDSASLAPDSDHVIVFKDLGSGNFFSLKIENGRLAFRSDDASLDSTATLTADQWAHVAVTRSGHDIALFVNGLRIASAHDADYTAKATIGGDLLIGTQPGDGEGQGSYFSGQIASVRLWTQALTDPQLAERYNDTVDSSESGLIGVWTGDSMEGAGGIHQPTEIASVPLPVYGDHIACAYSGGYSGTLDTINNGGNSGLAATVTYQWSRVGSGTTGHGGTVTVDPDGSFHYVAASDWSGLDSFVVQATGSDGQVVTRAIVVEVKPIQPPTEITIHPDTVLSPDGSLGLGINLVDPVAAGANQSVSATLAIDHAAIVLGDTMGVTVTGNGTGSVVVTGSFDRVEAVLNAALLRPTLSNWTGNETLAVTVRNLSVDSAGAGVSATATSPISCTVPPQIVLSDDLMFAVGTDTTSPITVTIDHLQTAASPSFGVSSETGGSAVLSGSELTYTAASAHAGIESVRISTENDTSAKIISVLCFTDAVENTLTGESGTLAVVNASTTLANASAPIGGIRVQNGATLFLNGGAAAASITVGGAVEAGGAIAVTGGRLTLAEGATLRNSGSVSLSGATLGGAGTLALASGGSLALRLATELSVALTMAAAAQIVIDGGAASASAVFDQSLTNAGTLSLSAGAGKSAALSVADSLDNSGSLTVSGDAAGSAAINVDSLLNHGQMVVGQDLTVTAQEFDNAGTLSVNATLTLRDDAASAPDSQQDFVNHGLLSGTGSLNLNDATFTNQGYLSPGGLGSAGTLTVAGSMILGADSVLALDLGGPASSDHLTVQGGTLTYGGTLIFSILANPTLDTPISVISAPESPGGYFTILWGMDNGSVVVDPLFGEHGLSVALHTATRLGSNATYDSSGETVSDYLIGTGINETVSLKGGADVFVGHGGGNRIGVSALDFHFIDGGAVGGNELRWDGGSASLFDATQIRPEALQHFDLLNLSGGGDAVLDYAHVKAMTGGTNSYTGTGHTLLVIGGDANHVQLVGDGWEHGDSVNVTVNGHQESYTQYSNDGVRVLVDHNAHIT